MRKVISILLLLLLWFPAYSQDESPTDSGIEKTSKKIEIYFDLNSCVIDSMYMSNGESIQMLFDSITTNSADSTTEMIEVVICSYSSPDGDLTSNGELSQNRTDAIHQHLIDNCSIPDSLITIKSCGVAWDLMRAYVTDSDTPYKIEVVDIIDTVPAETWKRVEAADRWHTLVDSRNKHLMELKYGRPYNHMYRSIFPYLRKSSIEVIYAHKVVEEVVEIVPDSTSVEPEITPEVEETIIIEPSEEIVEIVEIVETPKERLSRNPLFAVKTNLVGLGMGVANIGVEVPFKDHFSIDGSVYYSPYTISNEWKISLAMLQSEARYWLSTPLNKHFVGVHAHVGLFNIATNQWSRYQNSTDQPLWGFGVSYGYSLYLSKALGLEFNIGAGYASLRYDSFYNVKNGAIYDHTERGYWGVTRAGISLNYIINRK